MKNSSALSLCCTRSNNVHPEPVQPPFFKSPFDQLIMNMDRGQKRAETTALLQLGLSGFILSALLQYHTNAIPTISHAIAM